MNKKEVKRGEEEAEEAEEESKDDRTSEKAWSRSSSGRRRVVRSRVCRRQRLRSMRSESSEEASSPTQTHTQRREGIRQENKEAASCEHNKEKMECGVAGRTRSHSNSNSNEEKKLRKISNSISNLKSKKRKLSSIQEHEQEHEETVAVTPSPTPNRSTPMNVISVVKCPFSSSSINCSLDNDNDNDNECGKGLPAGVADIDMAYPCCVPNAKLNLCELKFSCACIHAIDHSHPSTLTEAFLACYGKDYHNALLPSVPVPVPLSETKRQSKADVNVASLQHLRLSLSSNSSSNSSTPILLLQEDPNMDYLHRQVNLTEKMRSILMDWLIELAEEYHLMPSTLHLAVTLVDRTLACAKNHSSNSSNSSSSNSSLTTSSLTTSTTNTSTDSDEVMGHDYIIKREMLQCVGCACMLIATKLEEVQTLTPDDFVYMSDQSYTRRQIISMEMSVCTALQFHLQSKTPHHFLQRFLRASRISTFHGRGGMHLCHFLKNTSDGGIDRLENLCLYLLELAMLVYDLVPRKPTLVAASALYLARATMGLKHQENKDIFKPLYHSSSSSSSSSSTTMSSSSLSSNTHTHTTTTITGYWTPTLKYYTGYDLYDLEDTVRRIHSMQYKIESHELKSVYTKYKASKYGRVSLLTVLNEDDLGFD